MRNRILNLFLASILLVSCQTDLSDIENRLDEHDKRFDKLESKVNEANQEIFKIDKLIKLQDKKIFIKSFNKVSNGYEFDLSDGSNIKLDSGNTPVVGVKRGGDGVLYWAVNDKIILDSNKKKVKVSSIVSNVPKIRVNSSHEWEFSEDKGYTWKKVLDSKGKPVIAQGVNGKNGKDGVNGKNGENGANGKDGVNGKKGKNGANGKDGANGKNGANSNLKVEKKDGYVIITYKGISYKVKEHVSVSSSNNPKLPIQYLTKYNVNASGDGFCKDYNSTNIGLFNWYETTGTSDKKYNVSNKSILKNKVFKLYHLASHQEWRGVFPDEKIDWEEDKNSYDVSEKITIGAITKTYKSDYNVESKFQVCYALRFKGEKNKMLSAYKYEYVHNNDDSSTMLRVRAVYLGEKKSSITLKDISKVDFWNNPKVEYIERVFPATGYQSYNKDSVSKRGEFGYYWTSTINVTNNDIIYPISMNFYERRIDLTVSGYQEGRDKYSIRLFSNK